MGKKKPKSRASKVVQKETTASTSIHDELIAAALTSIPQPVFMKVCRLCESKDGPFLNIFDADKTTAKKVDEIMPFVIAENDDLPHKICFRCSAKVEELYEFIQKCIKTQESLQTAMGKKGPIATKVKTRTLWQEKLNKSNMSNEDICNALIRKAMEGIQDIAVNNLVEEQTSVSSKKYKPAVEPPAPLKKENTAVSSKVIVTHEVESDDEQEEINLKQVKLAIEKCDDKIPTTRAMRSKSENKKQEIEEEVEPTPPKKSKQNPNSKTVTKEQEVNKGSTLETKQLSNLFSNSNISITKTGKVQPVNDSVSPKDTLVKESEVKPKETPPPINIMDHVSIIKVNGVGTLYLCKLCNRNFLKKDLVMTHGCAKNNVPKDNFTQNHVSLPEVPKQSTVKYIKMDKDFKKPLKSDNHKIPEKKSSTDSLQTNISKQPEVKIRPKAGPASRVQRYANIAPKEPIPPPPNPNVTQVNPLPTVSFPGIPSLNTRYKLVSGPDNVLTLIEDVANQDTPAENRSLLISNNKNKIINKDTSEKRIAKLNVENDDHNNQPNETERPYPVGLFQTMPHHSGVVRQPVNQQQPTFTTPAMKKQSYTVVQTGHPNKLLISTKPQPVTEEVLRKKSRKSKVEEEEPNREPYNVTLEETNVAKDPGFFTFINVDPLLQPSYVLPTHTSNIIQESQISTSTPVSKEILENNDKYSCNMCGEKFSREKKLLTHIQSHYSQMDEEDQKREQKSNRKRARKP